MAIAYRQTNRFNKGVDPAFLQKVMMSGGMSLPINAPAQEPSRLERLGGLLSGGNPIFDLGMGLLAASGPRPLGESGAGTRIAAATQFATGRQRDAMQNQAFRDEMMNRQRQQEAQAEIRGLLANPEGFDQGQMLGLLGIASPDIVNAQLAQGMLGGGGEERAEPSEVRIARVLADPSTPESVKTELRAQLRSNENVTDEMMAALQLQVQSMQLDEMRRTREAADETEAQAGRERRSAIRRTIHEGQELAELNDRLEQTALETGQTFNQMYRSIIATGAPFLERLGFDTDEARRTVADFDRFNKLSTSFALDLMDRMSGTLTDNKLDTLRSIMSGIGTSPGANRLIIADVIDAAIEGAEIEGIDLNDLGIDEAEARGLIDSLRGDGVDRPDDPVIDVPGAARSVAGAASAAAGTVADFARMGLDQIQSLDLESLTQEQLDAVMARIEALTQ